MPGSRSTSGSGAGSTGWCSNWEKAYPQGYRLEVSDDGASWRRVWTTINSDGGHDTATFEATQARHVRLTAEKRATRYGISLFDLEVYGPDRPATPGRELPAPPAR